MAVTLNACSSSPLNTHDFLLQVTSTDVYKIAVDQLQPKKH